MPILFYLFRQYIVLVVMAVLLTVNLAGCSKGPMDPVRRAQIQSRDDYIRLAKEHLAHDEIFYLNEAGESLFINALNLSADLLAAGRTRWTEDKRYVGLLETWLPADSPGRIVLVGLYTKGIVKEDVLTNGRFRLQLRSGTIVNDPLEVIEVKPEILSDYFPVFNRWEKVVAVRFPTDLQPNPVLLVHWPSGNRELTLVGPKPPSAGPNEGRGN